MIITPNPTSNSIFLTDVSKCTISVIDLQGKEVLQLLSINDYIHINVSMLQEACYIINVFNGQVIRGRKLMIRR